MSSTSSTTMMVSVTHAQQHRRDGALGVSFGGMNAAARSSAVGRVDANRASSAAAGSSSACRSSERASSSMRVFSMRRTSRGRVVLWSSTSSSAPAMAVCCWCVGSSLELLGGSKGSLCTHGPRSLRAGTLHLIQNLRSAGTPRRLQTSAPLGGTPPFGLRRCGSACGRCAASSLHHGGSSTLSLMRVTRSSRRAWLWRPVQARHTRPA